MAPAIVQQTKISPFWCFFYSLERVNQATAILFYIFTPLMWKVCSYIWISELYVCSANCLEFQKHSISHIHMVKMRKKQRVLNMNVTFWCSKGIFWDVESIFDGIKVEELRLNTWNLIVALLVKGVK